MTDSTQHDPEISVVIVNYRSTDLLRDCLDALAESTIAALLQVIVVDNATPGFEPDSIQLDDLDLTVLPQASNTTFTGGNNIGTGKARGRFLLMLNPDTRVDPEALERAVRHFDADPALVALGAWFVDVHGAFRPYYRRLPRLRDVPVVLIPRLLDWTPMARRYRMADETFATGTMVEQPAGAFLLARRSSCPRPLLDDGYLNFFSDVDLCRVLGEVGQIRVEPDVRCYHARGGAGLITHEPEARSRLHQDLRLGCASLLPACPSPRAGLARNLGTRFLADPPLPVRHGGATARARYRDGDAGITAGQAAPLRERDGSEHLTRPRVLLVMHELSRTGAPMVALRLFEALADELDIRVVARSGGPLEASFRRAFPLAVLRPDIPGAGALGRFRAVTFGLLEGSWRPDVVYVNTVAALPTWNRLWAVRRHRSAGVAACARGPRVHGRGRVDISWPDRSGA